MHFKRSVERPGVEFEVGFSGEVVQGHIENVDHTIGDLYGRFRLVPFVATMMLLKVPQVRNYIDGIEYSGGILELIHMEEGGTVEATAANFGTDYYPFGLQVNSGIGQPSPKNNYLYQPVG